MFINARPSRRSPVEVKPANERIKICFCEISRSFHEVFHTKDVVLWETCGLRVVRIIEWKLGVSSIIAGHCGKQFIREMGGYIIGGETTI